MPFLYQEKYIREANSISENSELDRSLLGDQQGSSDSVNHQKKQQKKLGNEVTSRTPDLLAEVNARLSL
jgi:hypothetical protein